MPDIIAAYLLIMFSLFPIVWGCTESLSKGLAWGMFWPILILIYAVKGMIIIAEEIIR